MDLLPHHGKFSNYLFGFWTKIGVGIEMHNLSKEKYTKHVYLLMHKNKAVAAVSLFLTSGTPMLYLVSSCLFPIFTSKF